MRQGLLAILAMGLLGGLLAGCFPKTGALPGPVTASDAAETVVLARGRGAFVAKCNDCHGYPDLLDVPQAEWGEIAERMGKKADLSPGKRSALVRYIFAARAAQAGAAAP